MRLLNDPAARPRFGDAGRARVEAEFGVDRLVEGTLAAYRHVLERNPTTAGSHLAAPATRLPEGIACTSREIWRYPVKSMAGERLTEAMIAPGGIAGDRRLHVEDARGRIVTARTHARLLGHRARTGTDGQVLVDDRPWFDPGVAADLAASPAAGAQLVPDHRRRVRHPAAARRHRRRHRGVRARRPAAAPEPGDRRRARARRARLGGARPAHRRGADRAGRPARSLRDDDLRSRHAGPGSRRAEVDRPPLRRFAGLECDAAGRVAASAWGTR